MKPLFMDLPVVFCTAGYSVVPELPATPFVPLNTIITFLLLPSNIYLGTYTSREQAVPAALACRIFFPNNSLWCHSKITYRTTPLQL